MRYITIALCKLKIKKSSIFTSIKKFRLKNRLIFYNHTPHVHNQNKFTIEKRDQIF